MSAKSKLTLLLDLSDKLFNSKLDKMNGKFDKFTDKLDKKLGGVFGGAKIKSMMKATAIAGIAAIGTLSAKGLEAAERFDSAFLPIQQLNLDKSKSEINDYKNQIRDASFEIGTNIVDGTNAVYDLQSATGLYGKDAIDIYKKVGQYSIATGANINDSMNSTTKAMKAFGLGVEDIDSLLASNAKTVQVGITTFDELAKVQTEYAGAAASAGQGVDTANKVFAMFTSVAKSSDIGANLTKTFFQGLGQQADKFKKVLKINVFDKKGSMRAADEILQDIGATFETMTDKEITQAINAIGGPEGLRGALDKVKTGADDMIATFNAFDSSAFSMEDAVKNAQGDFATMKKVFFDRVEILMTKFGEKIMPMVAQIFDTLTPVLEWLYKNIDWLLPILGTFATVLSVVTAATWAWNFALMANPVGLVIATIAALIVLVVQAIRHFDEWGAGVLALMGPFGMIINIIKTLYDQWDSVVEAFESDGIEGALNRINQLIMDALLKPIQQLLGWVGELTGMEWAKDASKWIDKTRWEMGTHEPLKIEIPELPEINKKPETKNPEGLYKAKAGKYSGKKKGKGLGDTVNKVTGDAKAARNISIKLEALHKGDVNINGNSTRGKTPQQLEDWFNEMMMRVIRNAEMS